LEDTLSFGQVTASKTWRVFGKMYYLLSLP